MLDQKQLSLRTRVELVLLLHLATTDAHVGTEASKLVTLQRLGEDLPPSWMWGTTRS